MEKIEYIIDDYTQESENNALPDRLEESQKKYNIFSKNVAYTIGRNLTLFLAMLVPAILVAFIWTDFGAIVISPKMISDGVLTVTLFITGELLMISLGSRGGRLDQEYQTAKKEYEGILKKVSAVGTILMGIFCEWQIDIELEQAIQFRLRTIRMTRKEWESVKTLSRDELEKKYGKIKAGKICDINALMPIELNEAILLYGDEKIERGGVPVSGDTFLHKRRHIIESIVSCLFTGLLTVTVFITLTDDVTIARVVYTLYKLVMLLFRMCRGYERGARAFNTIEVRNLKAKTNYLEKYLKFIEDKIYLTLDEKYGFVVKENAQTVKETAS